MPFTLTSTAFGPKEWIPQVHTCDGADTSPPFAWTDPPAGTASFALICDDPDAPMGTWVHWVLFNLPAATRELQAEVQTTASLKGGIQQGFTNFGRTGYGGPCPPAGPVHRYFFKLYALDTVLSLPPKATKAQLLTAMEGHVLGSAELIGLYQRKR